MANIFIADSDQSNISSITQLLKSKGHVVTPFTVAVDLVEKLKTKTPEMIIIGVQLEGSDGRELSRQLQLESAYKDIPVILTSPFYHTGHEIRSFYCDDLVSLPLEANILATSVEVLLAKEEAKVKRHSSVD